ncbi:MAG: hypothetical protein IT378_08525 [Sandaracinaceae bacterium]|nr:hypothetical protein [Sandaracinaceae bacterium]
MSSMRSPSLLLLLAALSAAPVHAQDAGTPDAGTPDAGAAQDDDEDWDEDEGGGAEPAESEDEDQGPSEDEDEDEAPPAATTQEDGGEQEEEGEGDEDTTAEGQAEGLLAPGHVIRYQTPPPAAGDNDFQLVIPPLLYERSRGTETIATFPLFYWRQSAASTELTIPPYYLQRGRDNWDVLFPLFWWYRGQGHHTWIIPPVWSHQAADGFDFGVAPLLLSGRHGARHYTLIPPLLTATWGDEHESFTFSPFFWRLREREMEHWGIFPFLWFENGERNAYQIVAPFFFRLEDRDAGTALTVVPPFYHRNEPNGSYFGIAPLFHHASGADYTSTTIPPLLVHYSQEPDVTRLATPAFLWMRDHGDETFVTYLYQRFRGATELDAVAPFFFFLRDPRVGSTGLVVPPLVWHFEDPGSSNTVVFPFFARFEQRGRTTTWLTPLFGQHIDHEAHDTTTMVLPTIQISQWHNGDAVNIHPIWYYESVPSHRHTVLFPLWWDFESFEGTRNRQTVAFPFFWRFREGTTTSTLFLNLYHRERRRSSSWEWELHIAPFFSYGENSMGGHWWKVFFGLVGYERRGPYGITQLFYATFQTDGPAPRAPAAARPEGEDDAATP